MQALRDAGLTSLLPGLRQPVLGICLGMQLLCDGSAEDDADCLGVFEDRAERLAASPDAPVPNMGWCRTSITDESPLLTGIEDKSWFYFVHSYAIPVGESTLATAVHSEPFSAVLGKDNFHATQFHPERSSESGARLLRNFLAMRT